MYYPASYDRRQIYNYSPQPPRHQHTHTMTVEGKGEVTAKPDEAIITIGVETKEPALQIAQQNNSEVSSRVIEALKQTGIAENHIRTIAYSIRPEYEYTDGSSHFKGYVIEHLLEIKVNDLSQIGTVYKAAIKSGANIAGSIQFQTTNPHFYYQEALKLAFYHAKGNAEALAQAVGVTVNDIPLRITEEGINEGIGPRAVAFSQTSSSSTVPPIQTGELTFYATIKAIFEYSKRA